MSVFPTKILNILKNSENCHFIPPSKKFEKKIGDVFFIIYTNIQITENILFCMNRELMTLSN